MAVIQNVQDQRLDGLAQAEAPRLLINVLKLFAETLKSQELKTAMMESLLMALDVTLIAKE